MQEIKAIYCPFMHEVVKEFVFCKNDLVLKRVHFFDMLMLTAI